MLVSPAEPPEFKKLGVVSSQTERYGSDFIVLSPLLGRVGIQRKEIGDFIASRNDGRIEREIIQQKKLDQAIWLIEGTPHWTTDGQLLSSGTRQKYTRTMHLAALLSLFSHGFWILSSTSLQDSIVLLSSLNRWLMKPKHSTLLQRPRIRSQLADGLKDQRIHVMQGFDRVGYDKAKAIVEFCEGLPFVLAMDLTLVPGVGKVIDREVRKVLGDNS